MRNTLLAVVAMSLLSTASFAQKPESGKSKWALEGQIGANLGTGGSLFSAPTIRGRFFFKDNMAIRLGVAMDIQSTKTDIYEFPNGSGGKGSTDYSSAMYQIRPGFEYHLVRSDKFSPYVGAQLGMGIVSEGTEFKDSDGKIYRANYTQESDMTGLTYYSGVLAGMDWYVSKNIYLGAELGIGWNLSVNGPKTTKTVDNGVTEELKTGESRSSWIGSSSTSGIRFGWRF